MDKPVALPTANKLQLYLYSTRNIVGCCLGAVGLVLLFTGVIGAGWPLIVAGLYAAGAIGWPRSTLADTVANNEISADQLVQHLDRLVSQVAKALPAAALESLRSIQNTLRDLLPRLRTLKDSNALSAQSAFTIQETLRRYLPDMLASYLRLPPAFAKMQALEDGRTAAQTLTDQLQLLDASLKKIAQEAFAGDAEALIDSGRFLQHKFDPKPAYELAVDTKAGDSKP